MVRSPYGRTLKFKAKIDPEAIRLRYSKMADIMTEQLAGVTGDLADLENSVKTILHEEGVEVIRFPIYLAYARKLYKLANKFGGNTLNREAQYVYDKFKGRGLVASILQDIAKVLGITILAP